MAEVSAVSSDVGPVIEQTAEIWQPSVPEGSEMAEVSAVSKLGGSSEITTEEPIEIPRPAEEIVMPAEATLTSTEPEVLLTTRRL